MFAPSTAHICTIQMNVHYTTISVLAFYVGVVFAIKCMLFFIVSEEKWGLQYTYTNLKILHTVLHKEVKFCLRFENTRIIIYCYKKCNHKQTVAPFHEV